MECAGRLHQELISTSGSCFRCAMAQALREYSWYWFSFAVAESSRDGESGICALLEVALTLSTAFRLGPGVFADEPVFGVRSHLGAGRRDCAFRFTRARSRAVTTKEGSCNLSVDHRSSVHELRLLGAPWTFACTFRVARKTPSRLISSVTAADFRSFSDHF